MITSPKNDRVRDLVRLHRPRGRRQAGRTLVEGSKLLTTARSAGAEIVEVWADDGSGDVACSAEVIAALSTTEHPQSPVGVVAIPAWEPLRDRTTVVLWDVADPGNVGTIIRTAAAFGFDIALTPECADPWSPKVLRAAAGSQFHGHLSAVDGIAVLAGHTIAAALPEGGQPPREIGDGRPIALLIGNEAHGLPSDVVAAADVAVSLPLRDVESLNAAVAAGILMWELASPCGADGRGVR